MGLWEILLLLCFGYSIQARTRFNKPRENVWVTFANITNQSSICLSLGGVPNPFRTCLVGLPVWRPAEFLGMVDKVSLTQDKTYRQNCSSMPGLDPAQQDGCWQCKIILSLNKTLSSPPEELDLFGCANTSLGNATGGWFSFEPIKLSDLNRDRHHWANLDSILESGLVHSQLYTQCKGGNITEPLALPQGIFLICGDRAWNGIPVKPQGGPCYLGKLTIFHPNATALMKLANTTSRPKRSLHDLDCSNIGPPKFWSELKWVIVSTVLAGSSTSRALNLAKGIGCWAKDEINETSQVLDMLAQDVQSVNHAVLQNRASIDFLLLAQGFGCEEFEGMCCMNLSDHSESIHKKIRDIQNKLHDLKEEEGFGLDNWLKSLGLGSWVRTIILYGIGILIVLLCLMMIIPRLLSCIQIMVQRLITQMWPTNLLAQKEHGGSVESVVQSWLIEKRHSRTNVVEMS